MSADIAMYDEELKSLEDQVAECIRAMDRVAADQRLEKYNKAQDLLKRLGKTYHLFKVEVRMLEGQEEVVYDKKSQQHNATINTLKEQLAQKRAEANAQGSATGAGPNYGGTGEGGRGDGKDEARGAKRRIENTQAKTLESLANTEKTLDETEQVGNEAATTLQRQTDQIKSVNENLDQLEGQVSRAKKELNAFVRRMMTDKIILCMGFLLIVGIVAIVVLKLRGSSDDSVPPPTPAPTKKFM